MDPVAALAEPTHTPDIDSMKRADLPAIWEDFRSKLTKLKATAETLVVTDVSQKAEMKLARTTRLALKDVRVAIEKRRKELGEEALRRKQNIDASAKALKDLIEPLETRLLEQEEFAERAETKRKADLTAARAAELVPFLIAGATQPTMDLGGLSDEQYAALLSGAKQLHEAKQEAARKAEAERIEAERAARAERVRLAMENARLQQEASEREEQMKAEREAAAKAAEAERQRVEAEKATAVEVARKEREVVEAKAKAEREAAEAKAAEERAAREKVERELRERKEAEETARIEAEKAAKKAAAAPDREKLAQLIAALRKLAIPDFATEGGQVIGHLASIEIADVANRLETQLATL